MSVSSSNLSEPQPVPARSASDNSGRGIVARVDRGAADVLLRTTATPAFAATGDTDPVVRVGTRRPGLDLTGLAVGDEVELVDGELTALAPRRSVLARGGAGKDSAVQALAANVDVVLVTVAAMPAPRVGMVERLVALAWDGGATPVLVLTKADLSPDPEGLAADLEVCAPGVAVHTVSTLTGEGVEAVRAYDSPGRVLCLVGRSGAGKSTLANALLGDDRFATGGVRRDGKGRHTTVHRELAPLPGGGLLVDTPGLRGAALALDADGLDRAFPEIDELAASCRFSDCGHDTEPGCAIQAAIRSGTLTERRLASWHKLAREAQWQASRTDARLRAEQRRHWAALTREAGRTRP